MKTTYNHLVSAYHIIGQCTKYAKPKVAIQSLVSAEKVRTLAKACELVENQRTTEFNEWLATLPEDKKTSPDTLNKRNALMTEVATTRDSEISLDITGDEKLNLYNLLKEGFEKLMGEEERPKIMKTTEGLLNIQAFIEELNTQE